MTLDKSPTTLGENQFESFSLFSEYCFYSDAEIYTEKKITATLKQNSSRKLCQTPPRFLCPQNRKITAKITTFNTVRTASKKCQYGCTASLEIYSFLSSKFMPTCLELRALPCCMDLLKVSVAALLLLTAQKILFSFLLLLLLICS